MPKHELRAAASLAAVFSVRMLGLFMIYPVFALAARGLSGATPYTIGLALGIYGLTQGLLQMPFGLLSDRIGRKPMVVAGLILFGLGSAWAASAHSIATMIAGRALQGAGAVGSVILALVADLTAEENRTKAMAMVGMTIGLSFLVAIIAGPLLSAWIGVSGIFWMMSVLALIGIAITLFVVPSPRRTRVHREAEPVAALIGSALRNTQLLRLDFGIFALHAMLTASFLVVPVLFASTLRLPGRSEWLVYLPILLLSVVVMLPAIILGERRRRMKGVLVGAVAALAVSQFMLAFGSGDSVMLLAALTVFFAGFNIMEASLPSLVTKTAPPGGTGTATGVYSSSQFLGIFAGGVAGGWIHQHGGTAEVFEFAGALALAWLVLAATMRAPSYFASRVVRLGEGRGADGAGLAAALRALPGVAEAVVVADEGVAYLKVDSKLFDPQKAAALAGAPLQTAAG
ncbi:MAG: MFS transporter [Steroidobacteraceae bacterium]